MGGFWFEFLRRVSQRGKQELSDEFVIQLLSAIHQESIRHQTNIMNMADTEANGKETVAAK